MNVFYRFVLLALLCSGSSMLEAQTIIKGKIIDASTREPLAGATIHCRDQGCNCGCAANALGEFEMHCRDCKAFVVSSLGYASQEYPISTNAYLISMQASSSPLETVILSANRGEAARRADAPLAISTLSSKTLQETRAVSADQLLNKVSGVNMVNLGNEQHQMSIRQPMTTKSLFLYLEDGIPIRTTGLYNHNALLEMNLSATKSIEVIKGPSSSLYGSEAIGGVVNFISLAPTATPVLKLSTQANTIGYKRAELQSSFSKNKWGFALSGYYADKRNGFLEYSDYHKGIITARVDYRFSQTTNLSSSLTWLNYYSDMSGGIDSTMFANHSFQNLQSFTFRAVKALRYHSTLSHSWNEKSKTSFTALFRSNSIGQNPAYRVKDDYRKVNGVFTGRKDLAHGEINESSFHSFSLIAQHRQKLSWKNAVLIGGLNLDISPSSYHASYIRIKRDSVSRKYLSYQNTDSVLTDYTTALNNYAAFLNFEFNPWKQLRFVASIRYDYFHYDFDNHLKPSAFSGSPDMVNDFGRVSPKIGLTYNFSGRTGLYANYSEGFVPPQVTELYTGVKVPSLDPSVFYNYEAGGWAELIKNKLSIDISAYLLRGTNEVISVKLDDGSFANQNAGRTRHRGIEMGLSSTPIPGISVRLSAAFSRHQFADYVEKGISYNNNEMANAPHWIYNAEAWYRPSYLKGFRIGAELQHVGRYFADPQNTASYDGYYALNLRAAYALGAVEIWLHVLNATDNYYSYITSKSASGWSFQLAEPRNFNFGISCDLAFLVKNKQQP